MNENETPEERKERMECYKEYARRDRLKSLDVEYEEYEKTMERCFDRDVCNNGLSEELIRTVAVQEKWQRASDVSPTEWRLRCRLTSLAAAMSGLEKELCTADGAASCKTCDGSAT